MHTLAIYNLKNWELAFSQSNSSFKLELGLWDSTESRITGKKNTKETMRSGRVYAHRGLCSNNCWSEGRIPCAEKSPIMQMTSNKLQ